MDKQEREEFFKMLEQSNKKNMDEIHTRFLVALEDTEDNMKKAFFDETSRLDTRIDKLEGRFDGMGGRFDVMGGRFDRLENTVNFIKDFLMNNLVPRIEKLESGYQYLLKLVTSK